MKFACVILVFAFLVVEAGCRKKEDQFVCPQVVSPNNYATFHSGDTISISVYLPAAIQGNSSLLFTEVSNNWYHGYDTARLDTFFYPVFDANHYATIKIILKAASNGVDSIYIDTGDGPGTIICRGITIYIQP